MTRTLVISARRALAAVVLAGGITVAALIATPRSEVVHSFGTVASPSMVPTPLVVTTPSWAIPAGIVLGLLVIALATLLYRPRPFSR